MLKCFKLTIMHLLRRLAASNLTTEVTKIDSKVRIELLGLIDKLLKVGFVLWGLSPIKCGSVFIPKRIEVWSGEARPTLGKPARPKQAALALNMPRRSTNCCRLGKGMIAHSCCRAGTISPAVAGRRPRTWSIYPIFRTNSNTLSFSPSQLSTYTSMIPSMTPSINRDMSRPACLRNSVAATCRNRWGARARLSRGYSCRFARFSRGVRESRPKAPKHCRLANQQSVSRCTRGLRSDEKKLSSAGLARE